MATDFESLVGGGACGVREHDHLLRMRRLSDPYIYSHLPFIPAGIVTLSTRGLVDQCQLSRVNDVNPLLKNEQHFKRTVPKLGSVL